MRYFKVAIVTNVHSPLFYCNHNGSSRSYEKHNKLSCEPVSAVVLDDHNRVVDITLTKNNLAQLLDVLSYQQIPTYDCDNAIITAVPMTSMTTYNNNTVLMAVINFYKKSDGSITHQSLLSAISYDRFMNVDRVLQDLEQLKQIECIANIYTL